MKLAEPSSIMELCAQLFDLWTEWGAHIAAVKGYERGKSDAAEGKPERETLPCDIHRMYEDAYQRGYREGYRYGDEQPEF